MNRVLFFGLLCLMALLNACSVGQKVVYVKDMGENVSYPIAEVAPLTIQKSDRLSVFISAKNPELAAPFNNEMGSFSVQPTGVVTPGSTPTAMKAGYLVDQSGNIEFPILGTIAVEGKTIEEIKSIIRNKLIDEKYITAPIVRVELMNLKINVLGEVEHSGLIEVSDSKLTLIEAISRAGGLTKNANAQRITIVREEDGQRKKIVTDIESKDMFDSPGFYLKQNDFVFVEPKESENTPKEDRTWRYASFSLGLVTIVLTALNLIK